MNPLAEAAEAQRLAKLRTLPEIQKKIDRIFDTNRPTAFENAKCIEPPIGCGKSVTFFKDAASAREYRITGMCQNCQDAFEAMMDEIE